MKILVGCTGSVATIKLGDIVSELLQRNFEVQVITTKHAKHFLCGSEIKCKIWSDEDEWEGWQKRGDPVLHIELRKWADMLLIAPLDANTMAKVAHVI